MIGGERERERESRREEEYRVERIERLVGRMFCVCSGFLMSERCLTDGRGTGYRAREG